MSDSTIPTVDLSPFFAEESDEHGRQTAMETIMKACSNFGFFQIANHGIPTDILKKALLLFETFFKCPLEEKLKSSPGPDAPLPAGYNKRPDYSPDKSEFFVVFPPGSSFNIYREGPPEFRGVMEQVFSQLVKVGALLESILNDCLGLPPNFLREYNDDRSWDVIVAHRYFPASESGKIGVKKHEDGNCITLVYQDEVGGLEFYKDGDWIPVIPSQGTIVVNVGDVLQVLSNGKFKSATHRVMSPVGRSRYSYAFFYNLHGDKWVEPLLKFSKEIGEPPKYRGFIYKEYQQMRMRNTTHPPSRPKDLIDITHYAITTLQEGKDCSK